MSTSILKVLPGKPDIKRHSPSILYISASLTMSTSILKALPGKLDVKRHSPSILYLDKPWDSTSILKALPGKLDIKRHSSSILYIWAKSILKALPGKLDIKRHSPNILYILASLWMSTSILKALPGKLDIKRSISQQASQCQQAFSKPCLVNLISKNTHLVISIYIKHVLSGCLGSTWGIYKHGAVKAKF